MFRGVLRGEDTSLDVTSSPQRTPRTQCPVVGNGILEAGHRYMWGLSTGVTLTWVKVQNNYCPVFDRNSDFFWNAPTQSCIPRRLWYWLHIDWCMLGLWKPQVGSGSKQKGQNKCAKIFGGVQSVLYRYHLNVWFIFKDLLCFANSDYWEATR